MSMGFTKGLTRIDSVMFYPLVIRILVYPILSIEGLWDRMAQSRDLFKNSAGSGFWGHSEDCRSDTTTTLIIQVSFSRQQSSFQYRCPYLIPVSRYKLPQMIRQQSVGRRLLSQDKKVISVLYASSSRSLAIRTLVSTSSKLIWPMSTIPQGMLGNIISLHTNLPRLSSRCPLIATTTPNGRSSNLYLLFARLMLPGLQWILVVSVNNNRIFPDSSSISTMSSSPYKIKGYTYSSTARGIDDFLVPIFFSVALYFFLMTPLMVHQPWIRETGQGWRALNRFERR